MEVNHVLGNMIAAARDLEEVKLVVEYFLAIHPNSRIYIDPTSEYVVMKSALAEEFGKDNVSLMPPINMIESSEDVFVILLGKVVYLAKDVGYIVPELKKKLHISTVNTVNHIPIKGKVEGKQLYMYARDRIARYSRVVWFDNGEMIQSVLG